MHVTNNENDLPETIRALLGRIAPSAGLSNDGAFLSPADRRDLVFWLRRALVDREARKNHLAYLKSHLLQYCHDEDPTDALADAVTRGDLAGLDDLALCRLATGPHQLRELSAAMDADLPRAWMSDDFEEAKQLVARLGVTTAMLLGEEPLPAGAQLLAGTRAEFALSMNEPLPAWRPVAAAPAESPGVVGIRRYKAAVGLWHWQAGAAQPGDRDAIIVVMQPSPGTLEIHVAGGLQQESGVELTVAWLDAAGRERAEPCVSEQSEDAIVRLTARDGRGPRCQDRLRLTQRQVRDGAVIRGVSLDVLLS